MDDGRNELVEQLQLQLALAQLKLHVLEAKRNCRQPLIQGVFQPTPSYGEYYDMGCNAMEWQSPLEYEDHFNSWNYENSYSTQEGFQGGNRYYQEEKPNSKDDLLQCFIATQAWIEKSVANSDAMLDEQRRSLATTMENQKRIDDLCMTNSLQNGTLYEEPMSMLSEEPQEVEEEYEEKRDDDQFSKPLEVESPTFPMQPLQFQKDEDFTSFKECKVINLVDPYLDTGDSTKACFFHFYLSSSFDFHFDLSNKELFECGGTLDGERDYHNSLDVSKIAKPPYFWVPTDGTCKFDEKWPPPKPPPRL